MAEPNGKKDVARRTPVGPTPTSVEWQAGHMPDGSPTVILSFFTPAGAQHYFFPPPAVKQMAAGLDKVADEATRTLIVPKVSEETLKHIRKQLDGGQG